MFLPPRFDGPILVAVADKRVIGVIGPLATMTDRQGATVMLPQYFGVCPPTGAADTAAPS